MRNRIMLIGEAYGEQEEAAGLPFVGTSGYILNGMLSQVGINRDECFVTNVFNLRPHPSNDVSNLCGPRETGIPGRPYLLKSPKQLFVRAEFAPELDRLYSEIESVQPNVIVALGGTAAWAILDTNGIKKIRGAVAIGRGSRKVVPTFHPAAVARDWSLRPIVLADLNKAKRESTHPEFHRPNRYIWIEPTLDDLLTFEHEYFGNAPWISVDIETLDGQITCIGFAPSADRGLVIPIFNNGISYWNETDEPLVWDIIRRWCAIYPTIFQNGLYDMHILWRNYGIPCRRPEHDTMLLHHALQPELEKGLGFLGSVYTDEASWKFMRKSTTLKKEDL